MPSSTVNLANTTAVLTSGPRPLSLRSVAQRLPSLRRVAAGLFLSATLLNPSMALAGFNSGGFMMQTAMNQTQLTLLTVAADNVAPNPNTLSPKTPITKYGNPFSEYRQDVLMAPWSNQSKFKQTLNTYSQLVGLAIAQELPAFTKTAQPSYRLVALCEEVSAIKALKPSVVPPATFTSCQSNAVQQVIAQRIATDHRNGVILRDFAIFLAAATTLFCFAMVAGPSIIESTKKRFKFNKKDKEVVRSGGPVPRV